ncbi:hypothetical protein [Burkholderia glumae]|uniref:hypothetical protein n=1 Tax=Burkholderia glumae TaxID=337 RepID=UPI000F5DF86D|nr:hypothetical protein [Burkholderia glumae]MCM2494635.1 hypothetical protein [Burkholderia glumae]MCM2545505.1 hypothetical protein [Burkholderia glumae]MCQ0030594.1 hypothetical protein [Burkholderia glumae]MCQ0037023.1 hypothetical protein [Burkholderia glumae]QJW81307.1 hypothetical protein GAS18_21855 [Burkholderia glumae]
MTWVQKISRTKNTRQTLFDALTLNFEGLFQFLPNSPRRQYLQGVYGVRRELCKVHYKSFLVKSLCTIIVQCTNLNRIAAVHEVAVNKAIGLPLLPALEFAYSRCRIFDMTPRHGPPARSHAMRGPPSRAARHAHHF